MKYSTFLFFFFISLASQLFGQVTPIPFDNTVLKGQLENGMTYYIKQNSLPENRAQFWLVTDAGAILEDSDQFGLAHFVEHMCFNGTKNFEKNDIIKYLQSIGMKFGPEINAYTIFDETVYMLQKVPIEIKENIDTSLQILFDWASAVSFKDEDIDDERGVIHEEWRTRRNADYRMSLKYTETLMAGSRYGKQSVIGDIDIIDHFDYDVIRRFYKDWYRPDLQAIIAVGDFDVNEMEKQIKERFSKIPKRKNPREREYFTVPFHKETKSSIVTDPEGRFTRVLIFNKHDVKPLNTEENYKEFLMKSLAGSIMSQRMAEIVTDKDAPMVYAGESFTSLRRTIASWISIGVAKSGKSKVTLERLLLENEKVLRFGFTEAEMEIAKKDLLKSYKNAYNEKDKQESSQFAEEYKNHFLTANAVPGIEYEYHMALNLIESISLSDLNALMKLMLRDENRVVVITAPDSEKPSLPNNNEIQDIIRNVKAKKMEAQKEEGKKLVLFDKQVQAGKVIGQKTNKELDYKEYTLSNGVKIIHKQTDFKEDEVLIYAFSKGGNSLVEDPKTASASQVSGVVYQGGLSHFKRTEIDKMLAGKDANVFPFLGSLSEGFQGSSSIEDMETSLQLIHLYFTSPRFDQESFASYIAQRKAILENRAKNPNAILGDSVQVNIANYHPRVQPMDVERLASVNLKEVESIYHDRFADPNNFSFFFVGSISEKELIPLAEKYLGSLKSGKRKENWKDVGIRAPEKTVKKSIEIPMTVPKSTVYISFNKEINYQDEYKVYASVLSQVIDNRLTEIVREEAGGTYGVNIGISVNEAPYPSSSANLMFDCAPEKAEYLTSLVYKEIERIKKEGVPENYIKSVQENKLKEYAENSKKNGYWINVLSTMYFDGSSSDFILEYQDMIKSVKNETIISFANLVLDPKQVVEIIAYPAK
jgi:zinc protease